MQILTADEYSSLSKMLTEGNRIRQKFKECIIAPKMCIYCKDYIKCITEEAGVSWDGYEVSATEIFYCKKGGFKITQIGICDDFRKRPWMSKKLMVR